MKALAGMGRQAAQYYEIITSACRRGGGGRTRPRRSCSRPRALGFEMRVAAEAQLLSSVCRAIGIGHQPSLLSVKIAAHQSPVDLARELFAGEVEAAAGSLRAWRRLRPWHSAAARSSSSRVVAKAIGARP